MKHQQKVKVARKFYDAEMRDKNGKFHRKPGVGIFGTKAWEERRQRVADRVKNREVQAQHAAEARRQMKQENMRKA